MVWSRPLGLPVDAGGVKDVERIFGIHGLGGASGLGCGDQVVPPVIAAFDHVDRRAGAPVDDHVLDGGTGGHGFVDGLLELDFVAAAIARVLSDDGDAAGVGDAIGDGIGGESAEDDGVDGADARAGEQSNSELGRHAHVDGNAIAFLNAEGLEGVGEALNFSVQFGVGEAANLAGFALPDERGLLGALAEGVAIDAVVAQVELAADKPLGPGQIPLEDLVPGLEPVQLSGHAGPECFGIVDGLLVEGFILGKRADAGLGPELRRWGKDAVFAQRGVDIPVGDGDRRGGHAGSFREAVGYGPRGARKWRFSGRSLG